MIDIEKAPTRLHAALEEFGASFQGDGAPDLFAAIRQQARGHFERLGVPTRRDEAWK